MLNDPYGFLELSPVIPVMVIDHEEDAVPMAEALVDGGLKILEVTLRTGCALNALKAITEAVPEACVGAGTVCNADDFSAAIEAGARFVVSPGQSDALFGMSRKHGTPLLPGAVTASEVMTAVAAGFNVLKFFPASTSGGAAAIKALGGPFPGIRFVPTGGISPKNYAEYAALDNVTAVGGSWMIPPEKVQARDWQAIAQLATDCVTAAESLRASGGAK
ncbi:MAG: bifunctional 4-hydroxy-2-oxoglutarate aldolase/2-dehydro-3-deoxy-phosphogluconate aldolase [Luminiphilus sp.]|nr:bifunctional 4-hydroxy-2-oxoglutarate aldolase/2-dehydro-3-deoxy-phosphogluconate aldolase [Luminiphilus sp.]